MSSPESTELKGGHPPAVKAGGMRIARHRTSSGGEPKPAPVTKEEMEEYGISPPKTDPKHNQQLNIAGVITQGDKDYTDRALKKFHEKPVPKNEQRSSPRPVHYIQQPK